MTTAELLASLGDATKFPFFGGWVVPFGNNQQTTIAGVTLDVIGGAPPGDQWLRGYYRKIDGNRCDTAWVSIYVAAVGTEQEAAYLRMPAQPKRQRVLTLAGVASALGDPAPALAVYGALAAAAQASPPNMMAAMFLPLLAPGTGVGLDFCDAATLVGIDIMVIQNVLTSEQGVQLKALAVVPPTEFE